MAMFARPIVRPRMPSASFGAAGAGSPGGMKGRRMSSAPNVVADPPTMAMKKGGKVKKKKGGKS